MEPSKRDCTQLNLWQKTCELYVAGSIGRGDLLENSGGKKIKQWHIKKKKKSPVKPQRHATKVPNDLEVVRSQKTQQVLWLRVMSPEIYVCTSFVLWVYLEEGDYIQCGRCSDRV